MSTFQERLIDAFAQENRRREAAGEPLLTKTDLWKTAKVTSGNVTHWFNGSTGAALDKCVRIAPLLRVNAHWLFDETGKRMAPGPVDSGDTLEIERLDAGFSMGAGLAMQDRVEVVERMKVSANWLRRSVITTSPANLRLVTAYGDSMEDTFSDGDILLIDTGVTEIRIDAVYALELNGELYIKRLQRRPDGSVLMISDNKKYEPYLIDNGERHQFRVLGRVLLAWNSVKL